MVSNIEVTKGHKIKAKTTPYMKDKNPTQSLQENAKSVLGLHLKNSLPNDLIDMFSVTTE